jgi:hypothetical protein
VHDTILVGMDVHKAKFQLRLPMGSRREGRHLGNFLNRVGHVIKVIERQSKMGGQRLRFCYEAGRAFMPRIGKSHMLAMNTQL